jgi:tetratricopeptide (TPR) repeat protein
MAIAANCLGQQPASVDSQRQSAFAFEQQGKESQAETAWKSILSARPNDAEAYAHLGLLEAHQQRYKEAAALDRKALSLDPSFPNLRLNLGLSLFKAGELRGAIQTFEPLLKDKPGSSPEALRLETLIGLAHYGLGDYAAAVPYLKKAAASDTQNLSFRMMLAQSCLWSKQYQCLLDTYREILVINPNSAEADMLMGEAYDDQKNDEGAIEQFQAAVKADPKAPNVHFGYGYLLWKRVKFDEAEKEFRAELANYPDNPLALAYLGDAEMHLNHTDDALPDLARAIRIQPAIPIAHLDLGILYQGQGHKGDAFRELQAAERLTPDDPVVHWQLGRFYQSTGQKPEAKAEFEKTQHLQNAKTQSLREQLHQVEIKPTAPNPEIEPK